MKTTLFSLSCLVNCWFKKVICTGFNKAVWRSCLECAWLKGQIHLSHHIGTFMGILLTLFDPPFLLLKNDTHTDKDKKK